MYLMYEQVILHNFDSFCLEKFYILSSTGLYKFLPVLQPTCSRLLSICMCLLKSSSFSWHMIILHPYPLHRRIKCFYISLWSITHSSIHIRITSSPDTHIIVVMWYACNVIRTLCVREISDSGETILFIRILFIFELI